MTSPFVAVDETGHTGENLLDADQPVFALAGVQIEADDAKAVVEAALERAPANTSELKFSRLRASAGGRRNLIRLIDDVFDLPIRCAIIIADKPWMVAAKLVDELIEPTMLAKGVQPQWYASGAAKAMAAVLYGSAPKELGGSYDELARTFQTMVRDYAPKAGSEFLAALNEARRTCGAPHLSSVLALMIDNPSQLEEEFRARSDAIDPALTALFWHAGHWSRALGVSYTILHDDSKAVRRWQTEIFAQMQVALTDRSGPERIEFGEITLELPTHLDDITFSTSHGDPRLQVADVLAGAGAHLYGAVTGLVRDVGGLASALERSGIETMAEKFVIGPVQ